MKTLVYILLMMLVAMVSCEKIHYYPNRDLGTPVPVLLAHAGGGYCGFEPNSYYSMVFGLNNFKGIELDIQMSKDGSLWLGHDPELKPCGTMGVECFRSSSDKYIQNLDSCLGHGKDYSSLEEVFEYLSLYFPEKPLSLDVKAWAPCGVDDINILKELYKVAEAIIVLKNKYKLQHLMVESETAEFLIYLKDNSSGIECYLSTWGDFERGMLIALQRRLDGISFKYKYLEEITVEHVKLLHKKGLKIQLWVVNDSAEMYEALSIFPDFIQTDVIQ